MQITQATGLDTLQLLSGREALQQFKVGQIIRVMVLQGTPPEHAGGRALLEIAGRKHEVRSLVPLKTGQKLDARLQLVGNRLLLQPLDGKAVAADETPPLSRLIQAATRQLLPRQQPMNTVVELARAIRNRDDFQQLSQPLRSVIDTLLQHRPASPTPKAGTIRQALENAGIRLEAGLLQPQAASLSRDLKAQLFQLLHALQQAGMKPGSEPLRPELLQGGGATQTAWPQTAAPLLRASPATDDLPMDQLLRQLFQWTEGALARTTLNQLQSLQASNSLQADIPWITPWGTLSLQLRIEPDPESKHGAAETSGEHLQLAIQLHLPRLGLVQARLHLQQGSQLKLHLWCQRPDSQRLLQQAEGRLQQRLQTAGLELAAVEFQSAPLQKEPAPNWPPLLDIQA